MEEAVLRAIALSIELEQTSGRVYNVAAERTLDEMEWIKNIGQIFGWTGDVVVIADDMLPSSLRQPYDFTQHMEIDTSKIRKELDYREPMAEEDGLRRTIEWELSTLSEAKGRPLDYAAEDEALRSRR